MNLTFDNYLIRLVEIDDSLNFFNMISQNRERLITYNPKTTLACTSLESTQKVLQERIDNASKRLHFSYVIIDKTNERLIANLNLFGFEWEIPKCEIGYFIDKDYENKGIISKSLSLLVDYCFNTLEMTKLFMRIAEVNLPSIKVAEKNGFKIEGHIKKDFKSGEGEIMDILYYGKIKNEN